MIAFGEGKYFPVGTTWVEESIYVLTGPIKTTYAIKDEVVINGVTYNEVYRNDESEPCCLLREEGPLVYMRIDEYVEGLLYDFDWWEGKNYEIDFPSPEDNFKEVINQIEEIVLEDGQTYQIWKPELLYGASIICGIGCTRGILDYYFGEPIGFGDGDNYLLEFTRDVQIYKNENGTNGLKDVNEDARHETRKIRLKRNAIGGYDLQVRKADGKWQIVK
jgi:hypothetical protein